MQSIDSVIHNFVNNSCHTDSYFQLHLIGAGCSVFVVNKLFYRFFTLAKNNTFTPVIIIII